MGGWEEATYLLDDLVLEREVFKHCFYHHVRLAKMLSPIGRLVRKAHNTRAGAIEGVLRHPLLLDLERKEGGWVGGWVDGGRKGGLDEVL